MNIEKGKAYRIKGKSKYFEGKCGTCNPLVVIEGTDVEVFGRSWLGQDGNPVCLMFALRLKHEGLPKDGQVYYGHIEGLGELVHETELEEVTS